MEVGGGKRGSSPRVMTRRMARELEAKKGEEKESGSESARSEEVVDASSLDVPEGSDSEKRRTAAAAAAAASARQKLIRASNVAESAMKYYRRHRKEEVPEEDLLFVSAVDVTEGLEDADKQRQKMIADALKGDGAGDGGKRGAEGGKHQHGSVSAERVAKKEGVVGKKGRVDNRTTRTKERDGSGSASTTADTESGSLAGSSRDGESGDKGKLVKKKTSRLEMGKELGKVMRIHNMQIEELVRLTEADVEMVDCVKKGRMDPQEYVVKLKLNLSQKLDIIHTLQTQLSLLD